MNDMEEILKYNCLIIEHKNKQIDDYNALYNKMRLLKNVKESTASCCKNMIENSIVVDWLNCINEGLIFHVSKTFQDELKTCSLADIQGKISDVIENLLKDIKGEDVTDIIAQVMKQNGSEGALEKMPKYLLERIFSFLDTEDLKNVMLTTHSLRTAAENPKLAWKKMTIKSRAVLLFGLEHFLGIPRYQNVETVDFSFIQLETFELTSLCKFCLKNPVKHLNLSDKIFLDLNDELVSESLSGVQTLKVRYSTFSNDQINMILKKICRKKVLEVFDILGATITQRVEFFYYNPYAHFFF